MTVSFKTLGCKLNQAETEAMAAGFKTLGWKIAEFGEKADAVVLNTCTVTDNADAKSRASMNRARRIPGIGEKKPLIIITGCYVNSHWEELQSSNGVYYVDNARKNRIPQLVEAHFQGEIMTGHFEEGRDPFAYPAVCPVFRTRAMVKIQDGCDNFCTFCIIPFVRGRAASRLLAETVRAVEEAAESGYKEIILTGVNMARWTDGSFRFTHLLEACLVSKGDFRLRLGSLELDGIDSGFLDLMTHPKMTPHVHLCLQSGSERILLAMRRQYTAAEFEHIAEELQRRNPQFNLTTDVIVGFPGETDNDFQCTVDVCTRLGFGHIHTFPYSVRSGTRAARMADQISGKIKKARAEEIRRISEKSKRSFRESLVGSTQEVLTERIDAAPNGTWTGRGLTGNYVPVKYVLPSEVNIESALNRIEKIHIHSVDAGPDPDLAGQVIN